MNFRTNCIVGLLLIFTLPGFGQQQKDIPRISAMPDLPQPFQMRDWKSVAHGYDSLVFNMNLQGQYQPFVFFREQSVNYPGTPSFGLHTAVGTTRPNSGEGINVIPAVVGASLVGIDKSNQFGQDWVLMIKDYFNNRPEENIYLNHPSTRSGQDWWYETMPNIFFMQLAWLYPEVEIFRQQITLVADQWLKAVVAMGGTATPWSIPYMNYRAWNMAQMQPLDQGVKQPEAAGAIAWILHNAYQVTGERKYLTGAEWALEFLDGWQQNPSYELQLPYGIYTAARMNAETGTQYNIEKMLNWAFNRGDLRGWGAIIGNWGGYDVHGLIGEANDTGNDYAFLMNGFQQAAALVPMVRYDSRFALAIAKWMLNLANASRLFYPRYLPDDFQDNADWAKTYDPESYIAYEALREVKNNKSPYMTGDAIEGGWASTNLMLYGSSHVGYMASIADTTNITGILKLDLLATDFYRDDAYPTWLYYNPYDEEKVVELDLKGGNFKIYDVITKQLMPGPLTGITTLTIPAGGVFMAVVIPEGAEIRLDGSKTFAGDRIIDFDNGQSSGFLPPRIKSLAAEDSIVVQGTATTLYVTANDPRQSELSYKWYLPDGITTGGSSIDFTAPAQVGVYEVAAVVENEYGLSDSLSIKIRVVEKIPYEPVIISLRANPGKINPDEETLVVCLAEDFYGDELVYQWTVNGGTLEAENEQATYRAPSVAGNYSITCSVTNSFGLQASKSIPILVRTFEPNPQGNLIAYYPLHGDANDYGNNQLHGITGGNLTWTSDFNGTQAYAAQFNGSSSFILLPQNPVFNFRDALSVSFFMKMDQVTTHEQHPISHGSWEQRYKISLSNRTLRFTLNTTTGITDLDALTEIEPETWYHVAVVYNGEDMEIWLDGYLDVFKAHSGLINNSSLQPVLGQNVPGNNNYNFGGALSLLRIYDYPLSPEQIGNDLLLDDKVINEYSATEDIVIYPNPTEGGRLFFRLTGLFTGLCYFIVEDVSGSGWITGQFFNSASGVDISSASSFLRPGIYFLKVFTTEEVFVKPFIIIR